MNSHFVVVLLLFMILVFIVIQLPLYFIFYQQKSRNKKSMTGIIKNGLDIEFVSSLASIYTKVEKEDEKELAIREAANKLLNRLAINEYPIPVEDIIRAMGFSLYEDTMSISSVSGYIAIDPKLVKKFNNDKIIVVNSNDSVGHQRFTIAHELAHYIYDYDQEKALYDLYDTNLNNNEIQREKRANRFAAELMIPYAPFLLILNEIEDNNISLGDGIIKAAKLFDVSTTSIIKRFKEVGKDNLLKGTPYESQSI